MGVERNDGVHSGAACAYRGAPAQADERAARVEVRHDREIGQIHATLRRATRLAVQEARTERRKRREGDERFERDVAHLNSVVDRLSEKIDKFVDGLRAGGNGGGTKQ